MHLKHFYTMMMLRGKVTSRAASNAIGSVRTKTTTVFTMRGKLCKLKEDLATITLQQVNIFHFPCAHRFRSPQASKGHPRSNGTKTRWPVKEQRQQDTVTFQIHIKQLHPPLDPVESFLQRKKSLQFLPP